VKLVFNVYDTYFMFPKNVKKNFFSESMGFALDLIKKNVIRKCMYYQGRLFPTNLQIIKLVYKCHTPIVFCIV